MVTNNDVVISKGSNIHYSRKCYKVFFSFFLTKIFLVNYKNSNLYVKQFERFCTSSLQRQNPNNTASQDFKAQVECVF